MTDEDETRQAEPELCAEEIRHATYYDPPEFCEEETLPGSKFCAGHDPDALDDYLEARAEARRDALYDVV